MTYTIHYNPHRIVMTYPLYAPYYVYWVPTTWYVQWSR